MLFALSYLLRSPVICGILYVLIICDGSGIMPGAVRRLISGSSVSERIPFGKECGKSFS